MTFLYHLIHLINNLARIHARYKTICLACDLGKHSSLLQYFKKRTRMLTAPWQIQVLLHSSAY